MNSLTSPEVVTAFVLLFCMAGAAGLLTFLASLYLNFRREPKPQTEDSPEWTRYRERV